MEGRLSPKKLPAFCSFVLLFVWLATPLPADASAFTKPPPPEFSDDPPLTLVIPVEDPSAAVAPAMRYARMEKPECERELRAREIPFAPVDSARGVAAPERLRGPLHGVLFRGNEGEKTRETSVFEILDCRLILALDDFAKILASHQVVEVIHYSMYRPPGRSFPNGKLAKQHNGGLAIDAATFVLSDGSRLSVEKDFHGRIGGVACGSGAFMAPVTKESVELRKIACEVADARIFNVELTPMYNRPHYNHMHLEVTPSVKWFLVH